MKVSKVSKAATGLASVGLAYGLWRSLDGLWERALGSPAAEPLDFGSLRRSGTMNSALAAPPSVCGHARADVIPPDFPVSATRLRALVAEVAASEANTEPVEVDQRADQDRYVARSRVFRLPDILDVKVIDRGEGRSTLAIYSRSLLGGFDFGVNRSRVRRWLRLLNEKAGSGPGVTGG